MAKTEAQKRAIAKWEAKNTKTAACKLNIKEYELFKQWAEDHGLTVSGALLQYIRSCIDSYNQ